MANLQLATLFDENVAGNPIGIAPLANMESIAPNCSVLRRFKTSRLVENTCSFWAREVPHAQQALA